MYVYHIRNPISPFAPPSLSLYPVNQPSTIEAYKSSFLVSQGSQDHLQDDIQDKEFDSCFYSIECWWDETAR